MSSEADDLYARGTATLLASWEAFARGTAGAALLRHPRVAVAVFPSGPERAVFNNAVPDRALPHAARAVALDAIATAYGNAGVDEHAVWVHESDHDLAADLTDRGYRVDSTARAMAMDLTDLVADPVDVRVASADLAAHVRSIGLPDLLAGVDPAPFRAVVAPDTSEPLATAISLCHEGDCGIYNVATVEHARRRKLPIVVVNRGETKGDTRATLKLDAGTSETLVALADALAGTSAA